MIAYEINNGDASFCNIYILFEMLDQNISDIYVPISARPNHFRCKNIRNTFSMAT